MLPALVKTKPKQQQQQQQKKQFYELYDETRKSSPTVRKFSSNSREVDRISNIKNNSMELRMKQEKSSPTRRRLHESHIYFFNFTEFVKKKK